MRCNQLSLFLFQERKTTLQNSWCHMICNISCGTFCIILPIILRSVMPGLTGHLINKESSLTHISIKTTTLDRGVIQPDSQQVNAASVQKSKYPKRHIALIYRDLTSTNKTACGEYASRMLVGKQAPSMANTIAIDSKQGRRAKPEGSPSLLCAFHPRFWGEDPDERYTLAAFWAKSVQGVSKNDVKRRF